jgi:hypothetical protein
MLSINLALINLYGLYIYRFILFCFDMNLYIHNEKNEKLEL